jgi:aminobenzoyl-glutamate utilization protein B
LPRDGPSAAGLSTRDASGKVLNAVAWQLTAQGKLPAAHKGLVHVAKVMAGTAVDVIGDEVLLARAKADHQARVSRNPYVCPLPDDLEPPITMSA